jgi:hypothetical protein
MDPVEAAQLTGHSLNVWTRYYARSFGKAQRDEARAPMLAHGSGRSRTSPRQLRDVVTLHASRSSRAGDHS